ncbi:NAD(P)/FAD-dependent oxidoreductase [Mangrovibacter yixingensis]|uniref:NAD(P)/FAD-dependent oxidoreductase n=1 Tax=Mangrovibacter yixingensis TaxID=1529639 RepID=UPI001CFA1972
MGPPVGHKLNQNALDNLSAAWPVFRDVQVAWSWAGMIDVTPNSNPVIGPVAQLAGLTVVTGFSGHGFGTSPAAGQLAAELICNTTPLVNPDPYLFSRFAA